MSKDKYLLKPHYSLEMKKRNIIYCLIFINSLFLFLAFPKAKAHAANSMNLTYDFNAQELTVTITHGVSTPSTHYIETVTIRVNGTIVNTTIYTSQPTTSTFMYMYDITTGHGATIQVTSVCNVVGTLSRSLTVIDPNVPPSSFTLSTDAGSPDGDGRFNLIWISSLGANNYSVYSHASLIVGINQSLNQLADQNALSPLLVQNFLNGTHYFIVVAHNDNGDTLSNVESVNIAIIPGGGNGGPTISGSGYSIIWFLGTIALVIGIKIRKKTSS